MSLESRIVGLVGKIPILRQLGELEDRYFQRYESWVSSLPSLEVLLEEQQRLDRLGYIFKGLQWGSLAVALGIVALVSLNPEATTSWVFAGGVFASAISLGAAHASRMTDTKQVISERSISQEPGNNFPS